MISLRPRGASRVWRGVVARGIQFSWFVLDGEEVINTPQDRKCYLTMGDLAELAGPQQVCSSGTPRRFVCDFDFCSLYSSTEEAIFQFSRTLTLQEQTVEQVGSGDFPPSRCLLLQGIDGPETGVSGMLGQV